MPQPGYQFLGTLYLGTTRNGLPVWSQPGGAGTPVYPQQPVGERSALYALGCGHFTNCLEIFKEYDDITDMQAALVCCAMCSFCQEVIEPYENYTNYMTTPLVVA